MTTGVTPTSAPARIVQSVCLACRKVVDRVALVNCDKCRLCEYCSVACQQKDVKRHAAVCGKLTTSADKHERSVANFEIAKQMMQWFQEMETKREMSHKMLVKILEIHRGDRLHIHYTNTNTQLSKEQVDNGLIMLILDQYLLSSNLARQRQRGVGKEEKKVAKTPMEDLFSDEPRPFKCVMEPVETHRPAILVCFTVCIANQKPAVKSHLRFSV